MSEKHEAEDGIGFFTRDGGGGFLLVVVVAVEQLVVPQICRKTALELAAMDIVGPLPRSRRGNRFVLVVCDYATRYPNEFTLMQQV